MFKNSINTSSWRAKNNKLFIVMLTKLLQINLAYHCEENTTIVKSFLCFFEREKTCKRD